MNCLLLSYAILQSNGLPAYPGYMPDSFLTVTKSHIKNLFVRKYGPEFEVFVDQENLESRKCSYSGEYVMNDETLNLKWAQGDQVWTERILLTSLLQGQASLNSQTFKVEESKTLKKDNFVLESLEMNHWTPQMTQAVWVGVGAAVLVGGIYYLTSPAKSNSSTANNRGKLKRKSFGLSFSF